VIRFVLLLMGLAMVYLGVGSHYPRMPVPFESRAISWSLGFTDMSLDVILVVVGLFLVLIAWVFNRLWAE